MKKTSLTGGLNQRFRDNSWGDAFDLSVRRIVERNRFLSRGGDENEGNEENEMRIDYELSRTMPDGSVNSGRGTCSSVDGLEKVFKEFVKNHGTGCDDYDEFRCRFVGR